MKIGFVGFGAIAISFGLSTLSGAPADQARERSELERALNGVPVLELPAKAAGIVTAAPPEQRGRVTEDVLEAAIASRPASASSVVGAIVRANPSVATVAAATAVRLHPEQRSAITRAATAAAPDQSVNIVTALNKGDNKGQGEEHRSDQGNAHAGGPRPPGPPTFERPPGQPPGRPPAGPPTSPPGRPPGRPPGHYERP